MSVPVPGTIVTLRPFSKVSRPPTRRSTTACLRTCVSANSIVGAAAWTPNSAAPFTVRKTSAVWSNSLAGMHPQFKHTPPSRCSSTMAMRMPADAP